MALTIVEGDLFAGDYEVIGHGVNCVGVMGAGIAKEFRERFPLMYQRYVLQCRAHLVSMGMADPWEGTDAKTGRLQRGYNLFTQRLPGRNANLVAIERSVRLAMAHMRLNGLHQLALPKVGCGIGGLDWDSQVLPVFQKVAEASKDLDLVAVV